jgi:hypothetical protein
MPKLTPAQKALRADRETLSTAIDGMKTAQTPQAGASSRLNAERVILKPVITKGLKVPYVPKLAHIAETLSDAHKSGSYDGTGSFDDFDAALGKAARTHGVEPASIAPVIQEQLKRLV